MYVYCIILNITRKTKTTKAKHPHEWWIRLIVYDSNISRPLIIMALQITHLRLRPIQMDNFNEKENKTHHFEKKMLKHFSIIKKIEMKRIWWWWMMRWWFISLYYYRNGRFVENKFSIFIHVIDITFKIFNFFFIHFLDQLSSSNDNLLYICMSSGGMQRSIFSIYCMFHMGIHSVVSQPLMCIMWIRFIIYMIHV